MASKAEINRLLRKIFKKKQEEIISTRRIRAEECQALLSGLVEQAQADLDAHINLGSFSLDHTYTGGLVPVLGSAGYSTGFGSLEKPAQQGAVKNVGIGISIKFSAPVGSQYHVLYKKHLELQSYNGYHPSKTDPLMKELQEILDQAEERVVLNGANSDQVQKIVSTLKNFQVEEPKKVVVVEKENGPLVEPIVIQVNPIQVQNFHTHGS